MIRTRIFDFAVGLIVAVSAYVAARTFVSILFAWLFSGCVGGAVYVALRLEREKRKG